MNFKSYALLLAALVSVAPAAQAAETLDQSFDPVPINLGTGLINNGGSGRGWVQTVTAGITGTLSRIEILGNGAPYSGFDIFGTVAGIPTATSLGTATYVSSAGNFDIFSTSIAISAGQTFTLAPFTSGNTTYVFWEGNSSGGYAGGGAFFRNEGGAYQSYAYDLGFRTFVTTGNAVPEPATWAMMIAGFGLVGGALRQGRQGTATATA